MGAKVKQEGAGNVVPKIPLTSAQEEEKEKTRKSALKSITDVRRATAWSLDRWPLQKNVSWDRAKLHLPRSYLAADGEDVRPIPQATDLNQYVHQYYLEQIDLASNSWVNFVHADRIVSRRHEFLGPDPRVAGYFIDIDGDIHIRWWDAFLKDQWMDKQKWRINVAWNGTDWVEKFD